MQRKKSKATKEEREKKIVLKFFELIGAQRMKEARELFSAECEHHNPYEKEGMDALLDAMLTVQNSHSEDMPSDGIFEMKHVVVEGNLVAAHTNLQSKSNRGRGFRQIHLFRFEGPKIVEYWDVTQMAPKSPNAFRMF